MSDDDSARVEPDTEVREEGPLAVDIPPAIPAHPRPGTRTIVATTSEYGRWRLTRVGLVLDDAIGEEVDDYKQGLFGTTGLAVPADSPEAAAYAETQPDVALWEGERCLAVIRPRAGGDPEVTRFDGSEGWPSPVPSTEAERSVWAIIKDRGAEPCREALVEKFYPGPRDGNADLVLTQQERDMIGTIRRLGHVAYERLYLAGPYGAIANAIDRLGTDAVAELRRQIQEGR